LLTFFAGQLVGKSCVFFCTDRFPLKKEGRLNLTKLNIRRLAEAGHRQKDIAQAVGLKEPAVSKIINKNFPKESEPTIKTSSAVEEIAVLQFEP
jgi:hypothetical protein